MSERKWTKAGPLFWVEECGDYYIRSYRPGECGHGVWVFGAYQILDGEVI